MKLTRKLIPAMIMLLVSAVLMSTASFAWFSMNEVVEATGMEVTASSEFIFLEINGVDDVDDEDKPVWSTKGTTTVDASLFPVAHESFSAVGDIATASKWYYQFSNDPTVSTAASDAKTTVDTEKFGKFVATATYKVKLHEGMLATAYDLHVSEINIPANKGITVIVAGANNYKEFSATATDIGYNAGDVLSNTVTTSEQTITVYIYFNGADTNVYTDKIADLTGRISFKMTAYTADHT